MANYDFPTEVISLPSQGKCYSEDNPLSSGQVEIKYMAKEEEILFQRISYERGGFDKLFESIIVDKGVNDDIIIGDKNYDYVKFTRILGYGPEYTIEVQMVLMMKQEHKC